MNNRFQLVAILALTLTTFPGMAAAQDQTTVRVRRQAVVLEQPRGDGISVGTVKAGDAVQVLDRQGKWLLVAAPAADAAWKRGWLHEQYVEGGAAVAAPSAKPKRPGRLQVRGFAHGGGTLFDARDSFETILGSWVGSVFGGGGQIVFPNGAFAQVSVDRFRDTGSRALVSGEQVFTLDSTALITLRPIQVTAGYRSATSGPFAPYFGAGIGWHTLTEESPSLPAAGSIEESGLGYHVVGGVEYSLTRWLGVAGEAQWTAVPDVLGETGISAVFQEDNLGGTTFRLKFIVGF